MEGNNLFMNKSGLMNHTGQQAGLMNGSELEWLKNAVLSFALPSFKVLNHHSLALAK